MERISQCACKTWSVCVTHNQPAMKRTREEQETQKKAQHVELSTNDDADDDDDDDDEMNSLTYSKCRRPTRSTHHFQS